MAVCASQVWSVHCRQFACCIPSCRSCRLEAGCKSFFDLRSLGATSVPLHHRVLPRSLLHTLLFRVFFLSTDCRSSAVSSAWTVVSASTYTPSSASRSDSAVCAGTAMRLAVQQLFQPQLHGIDFVIACVAVSLLHLRTLPQGPWVSS